MPRIFLFIFLTVVGAVSFSSCIKELENGNQNADSALSALKDIVSFSVKADSIYIPAADVSVKFTGDTVFVTIPYGIDRSKLIPEITIKGLSIDPLSGIRQDFSRPVKYIVTARDNSTREFVIIVKNRSLFALYYGDSNNHFHALNPSTGAEIWVASGGGAFSYSDPLIHDGVVYAGCVDGNLYAFDAGTGAIKWKHFLGPDGIESPPAIGDNLIYIGSNDDSLHALELSTGEEVWAFATGNNVSTKAVFINSNVLFGSSDGGLYALDAATGRYLWKYRMPAMVNQSSPYMHDNIIFIGCRDGNLYAINGLTGDLKWSFYAGVSLEMSSPTVSDHIVYIGGWYDLMNFNRPGSMYAVDEESGQLVWQSADHPGFGSDPLIADGKVLMTADDGNIYAYDAATGSVVWKQLIYANGASAAVNNNIVYVCGGGSNYFYAFNLQTGDQIWKIPVNAISASTPVIYDGSSDSQ